MDNNKIEPINYLNIREYHNNARKISSHSVYVVKNSIREFGFNGAILVDKDNVIIAGHTRFRALVELGWTDIPCIRLTNLTTKQAHALRLADNKTAEMSDWDYGKLEKEIQSLGDSVDMVDFGFDKDYVDSLFKTELQPDFETGGLKQVLVPETDPHARTSQNIETSYGEIDTSSFKEIRKGDDRDETMSIVLVFDEADLDYVLGILGLNTYRSIYNFIG